MTKTILAALTLVLAVSAGAAGASATPYSADWKAEVFSMSKGLNR